MIRSRQHILFFVFLTMVSTACGKEPLPLADTLENNARQKSLIPQYTTFSWFQLSMLGVEPYTSNAQGMDIYNDRFLFQAGTGQNTIHIIDLKTAQVPGSIEFIPPLGESCHMNNINCGALLNDSDKYPLLYLSQTDSPHACFVLRIANDASSYELIQTIRYTGKNHYLNNSSYDWFIDLDEQYIYTYGHYDGDINTREVMKFKLPPFDTTEVSFSDEDILDSFILENQSIYQGSKIIDGILYCPVGYGNSQHPGRLIIIDLSKKEVIKDLFIACGEPEAIAKLQDNAVISSGGTSPLYFIIKL